VNFFQFADENPLDPKVGVLTRNLAFGENAYVVRGQANMTIAGHGSIRSRRENLKLLNDQADINPGRGISLDKFDS